MDRLSVANFAASVKPNIYEGIPCKTLKQMTVPFMIMALSLHPSDPIFQGFGLIVSSKIFGPTYGTYPFNAQPRCPSGAQGLGGSPLWQGAAPAIISKVSFLYAQHIYMCFLDQWLCTCSGTCLFSGFVHFQSHI